MGGTNNKSGCMSSRKKKNLDDSIRLGYDPTPRMNPYPPLSTTAAMTTNTAAPVDSLMVSTSKVNVIPPPALLASAVTNSPNVIKPPTFQSQQFHSLTGGPPPLLAPTITISRVPPLPTYTPPMYPTMLSMSNPLQSQFFQPIPQSRQPIVVNQSQHVEVGGMYRDNAKYMQYMPINISSMMGPTQDIGQNYAMETNQVGGVQTFMDQQVLQMEMDHSQSQTPKIFTYTYGNMMGGGPFISDQKVHY